MSQLLIRRDDKPTSGMIGLPGINLVRKAIWVHTLDGTDHMLSESGGQLMRNKFNVLDTTSFLYGDTTNIYIIDLEDLEVQEIEIDAIPVGLEVEFLSTNTSPFINDPVYIGMVTKNANFSPRLLNGPQGQSVTGEVMLSDAKYVIRFDGVNWRLDPASYANYLSNKLNTTVNNLISGGLALTGLGTAAYKDVVPGAPVVQRSSNLEHVVRHGELGDAAFKSEAQLNQLIDQRLIAWGLIPGTPSLPPPPGPSTTLTLGSSLGIDLKNYIIANFGWDGVSVLSLRIHIPQGVEIGGIGCTPAITLAENSLPAGSTLVIDNDGIIWGAGGSGGNGGYYDGSSFLVNPTPGFDGNCALRILPNPGAVIIVKNQGIIGGGGGGGGGGWPENAVVLSRSSGGGGGAGGAGYGLPGVIGPAYAREPQCSNNAIQASLPGLNLLGGTAFGMTIEDFRNNQFGIGLVPFVPYAGWRWKSACNEAASGSGAGSGGNGGSLGQQGEAGHLTTVQYLQSNDRAGGGAPGHAVEGETNIVWNSFDLAGNKGDVRGPLMQVYVAYNCPNQASFTPAIFAAPPYVPNEEGIRDYFQGVDGNYNEASPGNADGGEGDGG